MGVDNLKIWNECVASAKNKLNTKPCAFQIIKGSILKEAQKAYCAIMIGQ